MLDGAFAPWHIIIVALVIVVVFGSKRLPESARAIGQSMRILKAETRELHEPRGTATGDATTTAASAGTPPPVAGADPHTGQPLAGPPGSTFPGQPT